MNFQLSSKLYDKLKKGVLVWIPALSTLYFTLGTIWGWGHIEQVVGSLAAVAAFLGIVLGISKTNYDNSDVGIAGVLQVHTDPEDGTSINLDTRLGGVDPLMTDDDKVVFRVDRTGPKPIIVDEDPPE